MNALRFDRRKNRNGIRALGRFGAAGLVLVSLILSGCKSQSDQKKGARQAPANPVSAAKAVAKDVPIEVRAIGSVQAYSTVQVRAQVGGPLIGVYFKEGQDVKKGDLLFKIDPRPFDIGLKQAASILAKDQALLKNADDEVGRYVGLADKDYVTKERYDQLRVNAEVLRATAAADEAAVDNMRLQLEYAAISSPIDGRTGSLMVYLGNLVRANDTAPLVVIFQTSPIYVAFAVPEQNLPLIRTCMAQGELKTEAVPEGQDRSVAGVLTFIDNGIDASTGSIQLKATFPNTNKALWPGQFLNVVLTLTTEKDVVVVPSPAVQTGQSGTYVMVVRDDLTVESRPVTVKRTVQNEAVIGSGLKPGETVVTDGHLRLVPGSRVEIKKAL